MKDIRQIKDVFGSNWRNEFDTLYTYLHSGSKPISPLITHILSDGERLIDSDMVKLSTMVQDMFIFKWTQQAEAILKVLAYDPLNEYERRTEETGTSENTTTGTNTETTNRESREEGGNNKSGSDKEDVKNTNNSTHGENVSIDVNSTNTNNLTKTNTGSETNTGSTDTTNTGSNTQTNTGTVKTDLDQSNTGNLYGFYNNNYPANVDKDVIDGTSTRTDNLTSKNVKQETSATDTSNTTSRNETIKDTGTVSTRADQTNVTTGTDNTTNTNNKTGSFNEKDEFVKENTQTNTTNATISKTNEEHTNNTTTVNGRRSNAPKLLKEQLNLLTYDFRKNIFSDVDSILTLSIF